MAKDTKPAKKPAVAAAAPATKPAKADKTNPATTSVKTASDCGLAVWPD